MKHKKFIKTSPLTLPVDLNDPQQITKAMGEVKKGDIKAYVTTFGNVDKTGDVMMEYAFDDWLKEFEESGGFLKMLFMHDRNLMIGKWTKFEKDDHGIIGYGKLLDVSMANDCKVFLTEGMIDSVSVGFTASKYAIVHDEENGRPYGYDIMEAQLYEVSLVDNPANSEAMITEVKSNETDWRTVEGILRSDAGCSSKMAKAIVSAVKDAKRDAGNDNTNNAHRDDDAKSVAKSEAVNDISDEDVEKCLEQVSLIFKVQEALNHAK